MAVSLTLPLRVRFYSLKVFSVRITNILLRFVSVRFLLLFCDCGSLTGSNSAEVRLD